MRKIPLGAALAAFVIGATSGVAGWRIVRPTATFDYMPTRLLILAAQAESFPAEQILIIGDSVTEMSAPNTLCGMRVLNAGVSGATVKQWRPFAQAIVAKARPRIVVLALGTNDAKRSEEFDLPLWKNDYADLARAVRATWVVPPPTITPGEQAESIIDRSRLNEIAAAVSGSGIHAVDRSDLERSASDGIHPDQTGRERWVANLERVCSTLPQAQ